MKLYKGRVPACGVFCGGCPVYIRDKKPCAGAEINFKRCESCKSYHLCCENKGIKHCYECSIFPCYKFRRFAKSWLKYGQDLIENQRLLARVGEEQYIVIYNNQIEKEDIPLE